MADVTIAEVETLSEQLDALKEQRRANPNDERVKAEYLAAKQELVTTRRTWREQEILAGRRPEGHSVGGDAVAEG